MKFAALVLFILCCMHAAEASPIDSARLPRTDTMPTPVLNTHGDLLRDDPVYNSRSAAWKPGLRLITTNLFNWASNRYYFGSGWTSSGIPDWKRNLRKGPEWDRDAFGTNFIGHPHTGTYYYNVARSNGYNYWGAIPFSITGSLMWEYLGENERPSYNDLIMTTVGGMQLGEVFYRVTSNILDDRKRGKARVWREMLTAMINPTRSVNRITSGKMFRVTDREVYQKAPMAVTFTTGAFRANAFEEGGRFSTGRTRWIANIQVDYGDLFEPIKKRAFDFFRFRLELRTGTGEKKLSIIESYGLLTGQPIRADKLFGGAFQHFDYWRSNSFELGSVAYGGSLISKMKFGKSSGLYSTYHVALVPLSAYHVVDNFDFNPIRTYNFSGGLQGKIEQDLDIAHRLRLGFNGYFYWLGVYKGLPGSAFFQIFKPFATLNITKDIRIGFEHQIYNENRFLRIGREFHRTRTEQRLFLQFVFNEELWR